MRHARAATLGFVVLLLLSSVGSLSDIFILREIRRHQDQARQQALALADVERLRYFVEKETASTRAYLLSRNDEFLSEMSTANEGFRFALADIDSISATEEGRAILQEIAAAQSEHQQVLEELYADTLDGSLSTYEANRFFREVQPSRAQLDSLMTQLADRKLERVREEETSIVQKTRGATRLVGIISAVLLLAGIALAVYLSRAIRQRERMEQQLYQETVDQNRQTQALIQDLREERDAGRRRIQELLETKG